MHVLLTAVSRFTQLTGICRYTVNHAKALAQLDGTEITIVVGPWQEDYFRNALSGSKRQIKIATAKCSNNSLSRNLWYGRELPSLCARLSPDVLHLAYPVPVDRSRFQVPVLATVHDLYPFDHPENFGYPRVLFNRRFLKRCVSSSDAFVCVSNSTRERLAHYFSREVAAKYVTTICSYSELRSVEPIRPPHFPFARFILIVGQHRKNKNIDLVIRAYHRLIRENVLAPDTGLVIAGAEGPESAKLTSLVRELSLGDRVCFYSGLSDAVLVWMYQRCDLFVAASSIEGFCLPLVESMELSPRVICSDIPVFREIADDRCAFFPLNESSERNLAEAIDKALLCNPSSPSLPLRFSKERAGSEFHALYRRIAKTSTIEAVA